ncbi:hypothetical protein [Streptomyces sp. ALB3]|uniref:hypothetical protein n=1 Tax=Streptomyces sp. ALB3 TaxID=3374278 RepID=UPI00379ADACF
MFFSTPDDNRSLTQRAERHSGSRIAAGHAMEKVIGDDIRRADAEMRPRSVPVTAESAVADRDRARSDALTW